MQDAPAVRRLNIGWRLNIFRKPGAIVVDRNSSNNGMLTLAEQSSFFSQLSQSPKHSDLARKDREWLAWHQSQPLQQPAEQERSRKSKLSISSSYDTTTDTEQHRCRSVSDARNTSAVKGGVERAETDSQRRKVSGYTSVFRKTAFSATKIKSALLGGGSGEKRKPLAMRTPSPTAVVAARAGIAAESPLLDALQTRRRSLIRTKTASEQTGSKESLTHEEVAEVRDRCNQMILAAEEIGNGLETRQDLFDKIVRIYPAMKEKKLRMCIQQRGLETDERVTPESLRELAVALFIVGRGRPLTFDSEVRVAYTLFDDDLDGALDVDEFKRLITATLRSHLTLAFTLRLPAGREAFLRHLKEEYAEENLHFWLSAEKFACSIPTIAKAQTLYDGYIREEAPKQVNISAQTNALIRAQWHAAQNGEAALTKKLFEGAQKEVFDLLERDNFERFKVNARSMDFFVGRMFEEVDRSNDQSVSLQEYMEWATNNRDVMKFMKDMDTNNVKPSMVVTSRASLVFMTGMRARGDAVLSKAVLEHKVSKGFERPGLATSEDCPTDSEGSDDSDKILAGRQVALAELATGQGQKDQFASTASRAKNILSSGRKRSVDASENSGNLQPMPTTEYAQLSQNVGMCDRDPDGVTPHTPSPPMDPSLAEMLFVGDPPVGTLLADASLMKVPSPGTPSVGISSVDTQSSALPAADIHRKSGGGSIVRLCDTDGERASMPSSSSSSSLSKVSTQSLEKQHTTAAVTAPSEEGSATEAPGLVKAAGVEGDLRHRSSAVIIATKGTDSDDSERGWLGPRRSLRRKRSYCENAVGRGYDDHSHQQEDTTTEVLERGPSLSTNCDTTNTLTVLGQGGNGPRAGRRRRGEATQVADRTAAEGIEFAETGRIACGHDDERSSSPKSRRFEDDGEGEALVVRGSSVVERPSSRENNTSSGGQKKLPPWLTAVDTRASEDRIAQQRTRQQQLLSPPKSSGDDGQNDKRSNGSGIKSDDVAAGDSHMDCSAATGPPSAKRNDNKLPEWLQVPVVADGDADKKTSSTANPSGSNKNVDGAQGGRRGERTNSGREGGPGRGRSSSSRAGRQEKSNAALTGVAATTRRSNSFRKSFSYILFRASPSSIETESHLAMHDDVVDNRRGSTRGRRERPPNG